eukprot:scaffold7244_cov224-Prasinococcus_capsulatus_cf.AAC.2
MTRRCPPGPALCTGLVHDHVDLLLLHKAVAVQVPARALLQQPTGFLAVLPDRPGHHRCLC